jgi:metal-responsive CopG/Arc/MetJ family transcriptional regulator
MGVPEMTTKKISQSEDEGDMNRIVFLCPNDLYWAIEVLSERTGATRSEIIRRALRKSLRDPNFPNVGK